MDDSLGTVPIGEVELVLGLSPVTADGFPRLSVDFLRRKAQAQLRDALGRWVDMRGRLDRSDVWGDGRSRSRLDVSWGAPRAVVHDPKWGRQPVPEPVKGVPPRVLYGTDAADALRAVGEPPPVYNEYGNGYAVVTRDGINMVTMPLPYRKAKDRRDLEARLIAQIDRGILALKQQDLSFRAQGLPVPKEIKELISAARVEKNAARLRRKAAVDEMRTLKPDSPLRDWEQQMTSDALDQLEESLTKIPVWRRGGGDPSDPARGFRVDLDPSLFEPGVAGFTIVGFHAMAVNPDYFYKTPDQVGMEPGHLMPTGFPDVGRYTINHELGHMTDLRSRGMGSENRPDVWEAAKATGQLSKYGYDNIYEGYAEAFAMWMSGQKNHPVAKMYADAFGWDKPVRPDAGELAQHPDYVQSLSDVELDEFDMVMKVIKTYNMTSLSHVSDALGEAMRLGDIKFIRDAFRIMKNNGTMNAIVSTLLSGVSP